MKSVVIHLLTLLLTLGGGTAMAEVGPTAIVSKDSVVFHLPISDVDRVWLWDHAPEGQLEHSWSVEIRMGKNTLNFKFEQRSSGGAAKEGSVSELIDSGALYLWRKDLARDCSKVPLGKPDTDSRGLVIRLKDRGWVEPIMYYRPASVWFHDEITGTVEPVTVQYPVDPEEELARNIRGLLTGDEYAIYQTVIARYKNRGDGPLVVLNPSVWLDIRAAEHHNVSENLKPDADTETSYYVNRTRSVDISALSQLGWTIVDADSFHAARKGLEDVETRSVRYVRVSSIGFNNQRTQALVYCSYSCGMLCGKGEVILLELIDGSWLVARRTTVWMS